MLSVCKCVSCCGPPAEFGCRAMARPAKARTKAIAKNLLQDTSGSAWAFYTNPALRKEISPALLKTLKGKSCFRLKTLDEQLKKNIEAALDASAAVYKERGWL
jgi:hypothetical protein